MDILQGYFIAFIVALMMGIGIGAWLVSRFMGDREYRHGYMHGQRAERDAQATREIEEAASRRWAEKERYYNHIIAAQGDVLFGNRPASKSFLLTPEQFAELQAGKVEHFPKTPNTPEAGEKGNPDESSL